MLDKKRDLVMNYCTTTPCADCVLKIGGWEQQLASDCLNIEKADEKDLERALQLIGYTDPINPAHYKDGKIEVIDFIEDKKLGYCLGNAIKYIARAGKKDPSKEVEDLQKAAWYVNRRIKELEEKENA